MKTKVLVSALSCALLGSASAQVNNVKGETVTTREKRDTKVASMYYKEKEKYYLSKIDEMHSRYYPDQAKRFYLPDLEPKLSESELKTQEDTLKNLMNDLIELILHMPPIIDPKGLENTDPRKIIRSEENLKNYVSINKEDSKLVNELMTKTTLEDLQSKIFTYLKGGNRHRNEKGLVELENGVLLYGQPRRYNDYNLSDFEYEKLDTSEFKKKQLIEKKYEIIYLHIKAAGLVRKISFAFYPKSFLREYADQMGLTKFITEMEEKAGKKLKHDELAEQFFGSYDNWMTGFEQFLQNKIVTLKIRE